MRNNNENGRPCAVIANGQQAQGEGWSEVVGGGRSDRRMLIGAGGHFCLAATCWHRLPLGPPVAPQSSVDRRERRMCCWRARAIPLFFTRKGRTKTKHKGDCRALWSQPDKFVWFFVVEFLSVAFYLTVLCCVLRRRRSFWFRLCENARRPLASGRGRRPVGKGEKNGHEPWIITGRARPRRLVVPMRSR